MNFSDLNMGTNFKVIRGLHWSANLVNCSEVTSYTVTYLVAGSAFHTTGCILVFGDPLFREADDDIIEE